MFFQNVYFRMDIVKNVHFNSVEPVKEIEVMANLPKMIFPWVCKDICFTCKIVPITNLF